MQAWQQETLAFGLGFPYALAKIIVGSVPFGHNNSTRKGVATTSNKYADCFGFAEQEVFAALEEFGLSECRQEVKKWYGGFIFGETKDIYNPWSMIGFLDERKVGTYWANSSSNSLIGKLVGKEARRLR